MSYNNLFFADKAGDLGKIFATKISLTGSARCINIYNRDRVFSTLLIFFITLFLFLFLLSLFIGGFAILGSQTT